MKNAKLFIIFGLLLTAILITGCKLGDIIGPGGEYSYDVWVYVYDSGNPLPDATVMIEESGDYDKTDSKGLAGPLAVETSAQNCKIIVTYGKIKRDRTFGLTRGDNWFRIDI